MEKILSWRCWRVHVHVSDYVDNSLIEKMNRMKLDTVRNEEIVDDEQKLAIISVELENEYVIEVRNGDVKDIRILINFHKSQNIRVRGK